MKTLWLEKRKLTLRNLPKPKPKQGEALIRVLYAGICNTDIELLKGYMDFSGVPGHEFVGVVEKGPKQWLGKRVVGEINIACGKCDLCQMGLERHCPNRTVLGIYKKNGAFAEYLTLPVKNLHLVPETISDLEAVFVEPLSASLRIFDQIKIKKNEQVVIIGDGKLAQLIARALWLRNKNLIVIGRHKEKLNLLAQLGITTLIEKDAQKDVQRFAPQVIIEATGNPKGLELALKLCQPMSKIVLKSTYAQPVKINLSQVVVDELILVGSRCGDFKKGLALLASKRIKTTELISGIYPIEQYQKAFKKAMERKSLKVILKCT